MGLGFWHPCLSNHHFFKEGFSFGTADSALTSMLMALFTADTAHIFSCPDCPMSGMSLSTGEQVVFLWGIWLLNFLSCHLALKSTTSGIDCSCCCPFRRATCSTAGLRGFRDGQYGKTYVFISLCTVKLSILPFKQSSAAVERSHSFNMKTKLITLCSFSLYSAFSFCSASLK